MSAIAGLRVCFQKILSVMWSAWWIFPVLESRRSRHGQRCRQKHMQVSPFLRVFVCLCRLSFCVCVVCVFCAFLLFLICFVAPFPHASNVWGTIFYTTNSLFNSLAKHVFGTLQAKQLQHSIKILRIDSNGPHSIESSSDHTPHQMWAVRFPFNFSTCGSGPKPCTSSMCTSIST